jgi:hypothetical protein
VTDQKPSEWIQTWARESRRGDILGAILAYLDLCHERAHPIARVDLSHPNWAPPADKKPDILRSLSREEFAKLEPISESEIRAALEQGQREADIVRRGYAASPPSVDMSGGCSGADVCGGWCSKHFPGSAAPLPEQSEPAPQTVGDVLYEADKRAKATDATELRVFHLTTELSALSKEAQEHAAARAALVEERDTLRAQVEELKANSDFAKYHMKARCYGELAYKWRKRCIENGWAGEDDHLLADEWQARESVVEAARKALGWIDRDYPAKDYEANRAHAALERALAVLDREPERSAP